MPVSNSRLFVATAEKNRRSLKTLRSRAEQLRLQAMRSQPTAATNFCSTAENALVVGRLQLVAMQSRERSSQSSRCVRIWKNQITYHRIQSLAFVTDWWNSKNKFLALKRGCGRNCGKYPYTTHPPVGLFWRVLLPFRSKSFRTFLLASRRWAAFRASSLM